MFELIGEFETNGKKLCTVKVKGAVSVLEEREYKRIWGYYHLDKWKNK